MYQLSCPAHYLRVRNNDQEKQGEKFKRDIVLSHAFGVSWRLLCLYWKEEIDLSLVSFSHNHIYGEVEHNDSRWRFIGIYEWPKEGEKYRTWALLRH